MHRRRTHSSVGSILDLRTGGHWFNPPSEPVLFPRIGDSHCDRIHSSLTAVHCFDDGYVGKQPVSWEEYCADYWLKETQESMDRCTCHRDIYEKTVEKGVKHHTINQLCT